MRQIQTQVYQTPFGELLLGAYEDRLCLCDWRYRRMRETIDRRISRELKADYVTGMSPVLDQTVAELQEYFSFRRRTFTIPLLMIGTVFQQSVWNELLKIDFGETATYTELALRISKPDAVRAVGSANGANALSILIPCHRIRGRHGELVGYAGGLAAKEKLLALEGANGQSDLFAKV